MQDQRQFKLQYISEELLGQIVKVDVGLQSARREGREDERSEGRARFQVIPAGEFAALQDSKASVVAQAEVKRLVDRLSAEQVAEYAALLNIGRNFVQPETLVRETAKCLQYGYEREYLCDKTGYGSLSSAVDKLGLEPLRQF